METIQSTEDLLLVESNLVRADKGKRFLNYLIDTLFFYLLVFLVTILVAVVSPDTINAMAAEDNGFSLMDQFLSLLLYALYMSVIEAIFKGKSLGKLITGTRAVYEAGSGISTATAFGRGFSRAVPFCAFSALGDPCIPWQDRWTNTMVIDERKSEQL